MAGFVNRESDQEEYTDNADGSPGFGLLELAGKMETEFKAMQELSRPLSLRSTIDIYTQAVMPAKRGAQAAVLSLVFQPNSPERFSPRSGQQFKILKCGAGTYFKAEDLRAPNGH